MVCLMIWTTALIHRMPTKPIMMAIAKGMPATRMTTTTAHRTWMTVHHLMKIFILVPHAMIVTIVPLTMSTIATATVWVYFKIATMMAPVMLMTSVPIAPSQVLPAMMAMTVLSMT